MLKNFLNLTSLTIHYTCVKPSMLCNMYLLCWEIGTFQCLMCHPAQHRVLAESQRERRQLMHDIWFLCQSIKLNKSKIHIFRPNSSQSFCIAVVKGAPIQIPAFFLTSIVLDAKDEKIIWKNWNLSFLLYFLLHCTYL